jgi:hypothetical protein
MRRRLKRTATRYVPPVSKLRREIAILREIGPDDPKVTALTDAVEEMLAAGYYVRHGGGEATESRRWPLLPEWGGKEPPETFAEANLSRSKGGK